MAPAEHRGGVGWRLSVHEVLPSTSTLLRELADQGEPEGLAILARRQTAGRGTQGRAWESREGNLFISMLLRPAVPLRVVPQAAFVAAVALHQAAGPATRLKWPNDLMLDGAKCAGILTETATDAAGDLAWLMFGIGVNLAYAPEVPGRAVACLGAQPVEAFAHRLLDAVSHWHALWLAEGFVPIREAWMRAGPELGSEVTATRAGSRLTGRYEGISEEGGLLLATEARTYALHSGEVA
ncbi:biotin--[acetyl-CoA-carboxylase] ligase [Rhodovarius crocodyli]|uniref:biotin--[biotin carboxyl-carrier protein] ligase n=1 Tax=Rhodovarius crocodyli TaxID=1979269 RepID=A0A437MCN7_9PROT|nr:biotin--[acetyl-CoA-carboxylase] ligase [Rhodovarius crocodyli]RVT95414.1 biotin--[acetyl-CoA-carboxylase] ligase [Rhodovarius crocodyli]